MDDVSKLTPGQRATLGVVAGMMVNEPASFAPDVDGAIAAVATGGAPRYAATPQERTERQRALRESAGKTALSEAKPKPTPEQALAMLEAKLKKMTEADRIEFVNRERSPEAQRYVDDAFMSVSVRPYLDDDFTMPDLEDEDMSDILDGYEDDGEAA